MHHQVCPGAADGTCVKIHYFCKGMSEVRYVPVPPSVLKNSKDNGTALKAVGVDPKTPHAVAQASISKGKDEYTGKGKEMGQSKERQR